MALESIGLSLHPQVESHCLPLLARLAVSGWTEQGPAQSHPGKRVLPLLTDICIGVLLPQFMTVS
jgi:hypothetical protein